MTTRFHFSIVSRLRWSLTALIVSLTALCCLCVLLLVFWFERTLFYNHLTSDLDKYIQAYSTTDSALVKPQGDTTFYKLPSSDHPLLPVEFQGYPEGNFEIVDGAKAYNLFVRNRSPWIYVLVQDQSEFEQYEVLAVAGVIIGFVLISGFGFMFSRRLAAQILLPITTLAAAVERKPQSGAQSDFAPESYPNDEVGALAAAVQRYSDQISDLLEREKQFTADVSHELRTPMMVIQAATDLLKESSRGYPAETRVIARIERALIDMQQQTSLYLQLARDPGAVSHEAACSLADAARTACERWDERAQQKGIKILCVVGDKGESPRVPEVLIHAVLNNLLNNAVNHTEQGEITLEVGADTIAVRDSGSGVDPDLAGRIFERGISSATGPDRRYGIGLSIVKRICDRQRWRLDVALNQPHGSVFTVKLS